jgi:YD repeat-containing protein
MPGPEELPPHRLERKALSSDINAQTAATAREAASQEGWNITQKGGRPRRFPREGYAIEDTTLETKPDASTNVKFDSRGAAAAIQYPDGSSLRVLSRDGSGQATGVEIDGKKFTMDRELSQWNDSKGNYAFKSIIVDADSAMLSTIDTGRKHTVLLPDGRGKEWRDGERQPENWSRIIANPSAEAAEHQERRESVRKQIEGEGAQRLKDMNLGKERNFEILKTKEGVHGFTLDGKIYGRIGENWHTFGTGGIAGGSARGSGRKLTVREDSGNLHVLDHETGIQESHLKDGRTITQFPEGQTVERVGSKVLSTDSNGRVRQFTYDADSNLSEIADFHRDHSGQLQEHEATYDGKNYSGRTKVNQGLPDQPKYEVEINGALKQIQTDGRVSSFELGHAAEGHYAPKLTPRQIAEANRLKSEEAEQRRPSRGPAPTADSLAEASRVTTRSDGTQHIELPIPEEFARSTQRARELTPAELLADLRKEVKKAQDPELSKTIDYLERQPAKVQEEAARGIWERMAKGQHAPIVIGGAALVAAALAWYKQSESNAAEQPLERPRLDNK